MLRSFGFFLVILLCVSTCTKVHGAPRVPCYFIFGDSLSDAGNNNDLQTKASANYSPYGIDFLVNSRPTGRFTNGLTAVDHIATLLNFPELIAPFSTANNNQIMNGVNYASGSAGIRPETGSHLGARISLGQQLINHKTTILKLSPLLKNSLKPHLQSCLYTINIGSNDYINNYFMPEHYLSSKKYNTRQYADQLVAQYSRQITTLYKNGARKVAIFGLGNVGCALAEIAKFRPKTLCVETINSAVNQFNSRLAISVKKLNKQLPGAKFVFVNVQGIQIGPQQGITVLDKPCCALRADFQCQGNSTPCSDRNAHFFWDGFHPTAAAHKVTGESVFKALAPIL